MTRRPALGGALMGLATYRFGWPSKASWKVGDRALVCYTTTRR